MLAEASFEVVTALPVRSDVAWRDEFDNSGRDHFQRPRALTDGLQQGFGIAAEIHEFRFRSRCGAAPARTSAALLRSAWMRSVMSSCVPIQNSLPSIEPIEHRGWPAIGRLDDAAGSTGLPLPN